MTPVRHIRKNDTVVVITGKDKTRKGRVLRILTERNAAIVEGINQIKRHTRPNPQKQIKGGIVEKEAPVHVSNLMVVCPQCGKPARSGNRRLDDGRKVRICSKCDGEMDK